MTPREIILNAIADHIDDAGMRQVQLATDATIEALAAAGFAVVPIDAVKPVQEAFDKKALGKHWQASEMVCITAANAERLLCVSGFQLPRLRVGADDGRR